MKSYYSEMNLPEPVVPAVQALSLLKGQTALVTGANSGIGRAIYGCHLELPVRIASSSMNDGTSVSTWPNG